MTFTLDGFVIGERIGSGGFGDVWQAQQLGVDRPVAIKVGNTPISDAQDLLRFERECKALGRLSTHPNLVTVHTSTRLPDGRPVLVLEFVDGGTLQNWALNNPSSEPQLLNLGIDLAAAVVEAHRHQVLHRDLKPQNVLLRVTGEAILADFGIAQLQDGLRTVTGNVTASAAYAAPEVLDGERASEQADLYGIGVCLLAAATQSTPFTNSEDDTLYPVLTRVLTAAPPDLTEFGYSAELNSLVQRLLAKDPAQRPDTASAVLAEFQGMNAGLHRHQRVTPQLTSASSSTAAPEDDTDGPASGDPTQSKAQPAAEQLPGPNPQPTPDPLPAPQPAPAEPATVAAAPAAEPEPAAVPPTAPAPIPTGAAATPAAAQTTSSPSSSVIALAIGGFLLAALALFFIFGRSGADPTVTATAPALAATAAAGVEAQTEDPAAAPDPSDSSDPSEPDPSTAESSDTAPTTAQAESAASEPTAAPIAVQGLSVVNPIEVDDTIDIALDFRDYPIELGAGQEVSVQVTSINGSCSRSDYFDLYIDVLDASGEPIGPDSWPGNSGCRGFGGDKWMASEAGVYTVRFSSGGGRSGSTGSFEAVIATLRRQQQSIDMVSLVEIEGTIDRALDSTNYDFELQAGQVLGVGIESINNECSRSAYFDLRMALLDPDGNQVGDNSWPGNSGCTASGRWAAETTGRYTLTFYSDDDTGTFEAIAGVITQPTVQLDAQERVHTVAHTLPIPRDEILYEIELAQGQAISVEVTSINTECSRSSYFDLRIEVLDPDGDRLGDAAWPGNSGCRGYGPWQAPADGVYQIRFYELSGGMGAFEATIGRLGG